MYVFNGFLCSILETGVEGGITWQFYTESWYVKYKFQNGTQILLLNKFFSKLTFGTSAFFTYPYSIFQISSKIFITFLQNSLSSLSMYSHFYTYRLLFFIKSKIKLIDIRPMQSTWSGKGGTTFSRNRIFKKENRSLENTKMGVLRRTRGKNRGMYYITDKNKRIYVWISLWETRQKNDLTISIPEYLFSKRHPLLDVIKN